MRFPDYQIMVNPSDYKTIIRSLSIEYYSLIFDSLLLKLRMNESSS